MTDSSATPRAVFEHLHRLVQQYDMDGQADLFAPDGIMEFPFAAPGMPRFLHGRDEIRRVLVPAGRKAQQAGRRITHYDPVVVHETADPEVIVAEFTLHGEVTATGQTYQLPFIQVLRVRSGEIVSFRDYWSPQAMPTALVE